MSEKSRYIMSAHVDSELIAALKRDKKFVYELRRRDENIYDPLYFASDRDNLIKVNNRFATLLRSLIKEDEAT